MLRIHCLLDDYGIVPAFTTLIRIASICPQFIVQQVFRGLNGRFNSNFHSGEVWMVLEQAHEVLNKTLVL